MDLKTLKSLFKTAAPNGPFSNSESLETEMPVTEYSVSIEQFVLHQNRRLAALQGNDQPTEPKKGLGLRRKSMKHNPSMAGQ